MCIRDSPTAPYYTPLQGIQRTIFPLGVAPRLGTGSAWPNPSSKTADHGLPIRFCQTHHAGMHKNQPNQESNQAILARVKKKMDEPRMAEATRGEYDVNHTTLQELEKP